MRTFSIILIFIFIHFGCTGQTTSDSTENYVRLIYGDNLKNFVDSLKTQIISDTLKFNETDVIFASSGRQNLKPYSKLFVINGKYLYKLDIIKTNKVVEFVNEFLNIQKIKSITVLDSSQVSEEFLIPEARQGVIYVTLYDKIKFNPKVAGLRLYAKKSGDNFTKERKMKF